MLYALDENTIGASMITIPENEAKAFNAKFFGIFRTVNSFKDFKRTKENLEKINAWFVEIDGDKPEQLIKIKYSPIYPSRVVESKNGYHVYFNSIDAKEKNYKIITEGLIHHFGGDKRAKDVTRVLREPGYYHWKDRMDPFMVKEIFKADIRYREKDLLHFFPAPKEDEKEKKEKERTVLQTEFATSSLTDFLNSLNSEDALSRLSGTSWVNYEKYEFVKTTGGRRNIIVNGKSTSCFIDENNRIGANPGGPTVFSWLRYFGHKDKEIIQILKEIYPEVQI